MKKGIGVGGIIIKFFYGGKKGALHHATKQWHFQNTEIYSFVYNPYDICQNCL